MSDLISRQAVMDATKTVMKDVLDSLPTRLEDGEEVYDVRTSELDFILNINKALQNAIKSLPSETHEIRTETHGVRSDELINRQDTIDAIEHVTWYHQNRNGQMVSGANSDEHQAWYKAQDVYEAIEAVPSAEPEIIYCKDCRKHNIGIGDFEETEQGRHWFWKGEACPLVQHRGKAQGHEFDYQYCCCAERREN